jgi:hypothetical protein
MRSAAAPEDLRSGRLEERKTCGAEDLENVMTRNDLDPLILDLLEWIAREPRSYADVIEAWRTSCPRLTVWEDAVDRGFAVREHSQGRDVLIRLTADGQDFLREHRHPVSEAQAASASRSNAGRASASPGIHRKAQAAIRTGSIS